MNRFNSGIRSMTWLSYGAVVLAAAACAGSKSQARDASTTSTATAAPATNGATATTTADRETTVQISKALRERCKLVDDPSVAPRFDYDQTTLRAPGRNVLDDVANCLTEGPLRGQVITLVGRADARGSDSYNDNLGEGRAAAARNYLAQRGVPADRMRVVSRGEQGARGNDEASYALDRRVDLELGDLGNSPILEGSMLQAETSRSRTPTGSEAASYADTAEGGKPVGEAGSAPKSDSSPAKAGGTVRGSASGSVKAGGSSK